nr:hypothetical protein [Tanacetum cinerariifolium]
MTHKPRKPTRKVTQVLQPSDPIEHVATEAVHKELGEILVRVAATASSLEAEQDSGRIKAIDADEDITIVNDQDDTNMFDVNYLGGEEVFVTEQEVAKDVNENIVEKVVNAAQDSAATTAITTEEITLAQAL